MIKLECSFSLFVVVNDILVITHHIFENVVESNMVEKFCQNNFTTNKGFTYNQRVRSTPREVNRNFNSTQIRCTMPLKKYKQLECENKKGGQLLFQKQSVFVLKCVNVHSTSNFLSLKSLPLSFSAKVIINYDFN